MTLENYFGALNMKRANLPVPEMPEKPQALIIQEQIEEHGVLWADGGLGAQPYILMRELRIVKQVRTIFSQLAQPQGQ